MCIRDSIVTIMSDGTDPGGAAGLGYIPDTPAGDDTTAFNANNLTYATLSITMTHEVGHNMGCGHSKYQLNGPGPGVFPYAAGWYFRGMDGYNYATVMAYQDDGYGYQYYLTGPPIFSSPNLRYKGVPVGDAANADNVRCLTVSYTHLTLPTNREV